MSNGIKTLEQRIERIEIALGIETIPDSWNISRARIDNLIANKHMSAQTALEKILRNFGETLDEEVPDD